MTVDTYSHLISIGKRQAVDRLNQNLAIAPMTPMNLNGLSLSFQSEHRGITGDVLIRKAQIATDCDLSR